MSLQNINIQHHPLGFLQAHLEEFTLAKDVRSKHIVMLNIAEEILFHLVGICIGEYKTSFKENHDIEKKLHWYARKPMSFGDLRALLEDFIKLCPTLRVSAIFQYPLNKGGHLAWTFKQLKSKVIDRGIDDGFDKCMSHLYHARVEC